MRKNSTIEVDRSRPDRIRVVERALDRLPPGHIRLRVDRLAVTANTVSYAVAGDALGYWDFFPADDPAFGRVPAMGWGDIVESAHPEISPGDRVYGWFPLATYLDLDATPVASGVRDDGPHRTAHAGVYRVYARTSSDPMYPRAPQNAHEQADAEDRHALLRGLFLTGFLADAYLEDQLYLGAEQVAVLSASSKTAIAFAHQAAQRPLALVGVTSPANVEFVRSLDLYHEVLTYDEVGRVPLVPSVSVDMSGNRTVLSKVHTRLGHQLGYSMLIGNSHQDSSNAEIVGGPPTRFFFAPTAVSRLVERLGREEYERMTTTALDRFIRHSKTWLAIEHAEGVAASSATWSAVVGGSVPPHVGRIVSLHDRPTETAGRRNQR